MFIPPILKLAMDKNRFCQSSRGLNKWAKDTNVASEGAVDGLGDGQSKAANRVVACHVSSKSGRLSTSPALVPSSGMRLINSTLLFMLSIQNSMPGPL